MKLHKPEPQIIALFKERITSFNFLISNEFSCNEINLLSVVTYELKTLLSAIIGFANFVKNKIRQNGAIAVKSTRGIGSEVIINFSYQQHQMQTLHHYETLRSVSYPKKKTPVKKFAGVFLFLGVKFLTLVQEILMSGFDKLGMTLKL